MNTFTLDKNLRKTLKDMFSRRGFGNRLVVPTIEKDGNIKDLVYEIDDVIESVIKINKQPTQKVLNFDYYLLPVGMEQVYGVDRNGNRFNSMAMVNPINKLKSIIKNLKNFKEYTPKQDTFGDGWNECIKQLLKEIKL